MSRRATPAVPRRPSACIAEALEPRRLFDAGLLDVQFNPVGGGAAVTNFRNANENGRAVLPMSDGRVVVVGEYRGTGLSSISDWGGFALVRHNADGSYDVDGIELIAQLPLGTLHSALEGFGIITEYERLAVA